MPMTSPGTRIFAASGLALLAACTTNNQRGDIVITKVVRPTLVESACIVAPTTDELAFGGIDPNVATSYVMGVVVENRLPFAVQGTNRLNTNDFQVEQARVSYEVLAGGALALEEKVTPANGLVKAGQSKAAGTVLMPDDIVTLLRGGSRTVRLKMRLEGRFLDGSSAKTSQYEYAIKACAGCGPAAPVCGVGETAVTCAPGQDSDVGCK